MGELVDGVWERTPLDTKATGGKFRRPPSVFRNWITADGAAGPTGAGGFAAEAGRYHLYVSYACPWAHRTLIMRALKGLQSPIGVSVLNWFMGQDGWTFDPTEDGVVGDSVNGVGKLYELYQLSAPGCSTRSTVPVLWDKKTGQVVSNESADIVRMLSTAFDGVGALPGDFYPEALRPRIDAINTRVYETLNNGVYWCGLSSRQEDYDRAVGALFETLDWLEVELTDKPYLLGEQMTEADVRLFPTLIRFDTVYFGLFKCNLRPLTSYPALWRFTRALYQHPAIHPTVRFDHIKHHYYQSLTMVNPSGVVPVGPLLDFSL